MNESSSESGKKPIDWRDILVRAIVPGLLIALTGFVTEKTLTSIASKQENARLIIELQIKREQAESDLRKDIFQHTVNALLQEDRPPSTHLGLSDRLLKLSLLSLNFGDSLSLAPLFTQFERDLSGVERIEGDADHDIHVARLLRRLRSLARQVASAQLTSLTQHGTIKQIKFTVSESMEEYKWPLDTSAHLYRINVKDLEQKEEKLSEPPDEWLDYRGDPCAEDAPMVEWQAVACDRKVLEESMRRLGTFELLGVKRNFNVTFSDVDGDEETVKVDLEVCRRDAPHGETCVTRDFRLDFFNFPKIDNTRLSENQRFALILESFSKLDQDSENGSETNDRVLIEAALVLFPAEFASLKDRPSMNEALEMLEKALQAGK